MRLVTWAGNTVLFVAGVAALAFTQPVRRWADHHGITLYVVALALLIIVLMLIERWSDARSRYPKITERDRVLFHRLEEEFSLDSDAMVYLEHAFNGKSWQWTPMQPILTFADAWGHTAMFDDPVMNLALRAFHDAARQFYGDAAAESHIPDEANVHDRFARLNDSSSREQYGHEWKAVRKRLQDEATEVVESFRRLYLLGRQRGY